MYLLMEKMFVETKSYENKNFALEKYFSPLWVCSIKMKKANKGYQAWGSFLVKEAAPQMNC